MFERPIVIGQRLRWRYADSNEPSEDAEVVNVRTDLEEGCSRSNGLCSPLDRGKHVQDSPTAKPFAILFCTDKLPYIEGKEIAIELL